MNPLLQQIKITARVKSIFKNITLLLVGIAIGLGLARVSPFVQGFIETKFKPQSSVKIVNEPEARKQALEKFYREIIEAESKEDWEKLYTTLNPSDKKWFSIEDMILYRGIKPVSVEYIVHSISVIDDTGLVDRTAIVCSTEECSGEGRTEQRNTKEYVYIDNQWYQQAKKEPTDKARNLAAYMYANSGSQKQKELADRYGGGVNQSTTIIRTWSIILENDPDLMAYDEALVEKHKVASSKQDIYVESPDINVESPNVIQQPDSFRCTSTKIGNYTYTNCY